MQDNDAREHNALLSGPGQAGEVDAGEGSTVTAVVDTVGVTLSLSEPKEARAARAAVRALAAKVSSCRITLDDVELMASEAITNALIHGSGVVDVVVSIDRRALRVEVWDQGPAPRDPADGARSDFGRGLTLIDALSTRWLRTEQPGVTCLYFEVDLESS